jgi:hypothetical protein
MRISENANSGHFVNKGKKEGRGIVAPVLREHGRPKSLRTGNYCRRTDKQLSPPSSFSNSDIPSSIAS